MKKLLAVLFIVAVCFTAFSGCSTKSTMDKINESGKLTVYTSPDFPPYEFIPGTETAGVDIEIAKAIAEKLGVELDIQSAEFDGIVTSIASGKGDIALSGITITEDRQKQVDFSDSYIESVQYLILPEDSDITCMEDLAGKKIGAAGGYTGFYVIDDEISEGVLKDTGATLSDYNNATDASLDLINGRIDAVIMDELVAQSIADKNSGLKAIKLVYEDGTYIQEYFGIAVKKGNEDLLETINEVISELKASGKIDEWILQYSQDSE